ncbi:DUF6881 domain-containing protein [Streptococcus ovuberis]|uniref:DUF6881 domain-containing protein n=1 Tax=Streptococcus ovuberis TaxID=1936207 RepID=A0A7X6MVP9_9STRE|nr:hypothetical protein [Streptococcus ovuberis]NKZ19272.1 hypothetical protein [Streptococcus ovuberis]
MIYLKCDWFHDCPEYPILYYNELDENHYITQQLEIFASGDYNYWDSRTPFALSDQPLWETPEEINENPELYMVEITAEEFEVVLRDHPMSVEEQLERYSRFLK